MINRILVLLVKKLDLSAFNFSTQINNGKNKPHQILEGWFLIFQAVNSIYS
jgi:hypothetical protein